ncbi:MAG TPA: 23S rRNA (uracil(1939)-C(5))-methyltransferase RlmD [Ktedonobacterales bacterium]|jgi:23S rRNA (uracil1939-C5)-methyltransferase
MFTAENDSSLPPASRATPLMNSSAERIITLELTDLPAGGDALGRHGGQAVFVAGALPGELVRARVTQERKGFARAEVVEILRVSPDRVAPPWPELGASGGFQWQFLAYPAQLRWKKRIVREQLSRIGHCADADVRPMIGMPEDADLWAYRTVTQFAVGADGAIGFRRVGSHDVIDMSDCPLAHPDLAVIYRDVRAWLRATWGARAAEVVGRFSLRIGLDIDLGSAETGATPAVASGVLTLEAGPDLDMNERQTICDRALASAPKLIGALLLDATGRRRLALAGRDYVYERVQNRTFRVSAGSFFQVNAAQTPTLLQQALDAAAIRPGERALDGYSGVGLFSLFLAERAQHVWAIESAPSAVADARANAEMNGAENITILEGQVERMIDRLVRAGERIDVALVDPPRAGCNSRVLRAIQELAPRALVYVSCDPATLARDLRLFCDSDAYHLAWVQPVDMFPGAAHIECVALCERTGPAHD